MERKLIDTGKKTMTGGRLLRLNKLKNETFLMTGMGFLM